MKFDRTFSYGLRTGLAVLCLAMTGCSGSVYHAESYGGFSNTALEAQAGAEGLQIQVDGSVGTARGAPLAAAVATAMPPNVNGAPIRYAPCETYSECPGDHLVWTFGPPAARPASAYPPAIAMNINWVGAYRPNPNNVTIKAALFQNGEVVSDSRRPGRRIDRLRSGLSGNDPKNGLRCFERAGITIRCNPVRLPFVRSLG